MNRRAGFTLIEVLITLTIMVTLLALVVFSLRSTQANARDEERKTDIANLVRGLESYYVNGDSAHGVQPGYYPGRDDVDAAYNTVPAYITNGFLPGVAASSFQAPDTTVKSFFYGTSGAGEYNDSTAKNNPNNLPNHPYLYQPLKRNDTRCDDWIDCVKFNIYYLTEVDDDVHIIRSKNQ